MTNSLIEFPQDSEPLKPRSFSVRILHYLRNGLTFRKLQLPKAHTGSISTICAVPTRRKSGGTFSLPY
jgi:hypothetical protein